MIDSKFFNYSSGKNKSKKENTTDEDIEAISTYQQKQKAKNDDLTTENKENEVMTNPNKIPLLDSEIIVLYDNSLLAESEKIVVNDSSSKVEVREVSEFNILDYYNNNGKFGTIILVGKKANDLFEEKKNIFIFTFANIIKHEDFSKLIDLVSIELQDFERNAKNSEVFLSKLKENFDDPRDY